MTLPRVRFWIFNYMPQWEGVSQELASVREGLRGEVEGSIVSLDTKQRTWALRGPDKRIPLPHGLPLYPLLRSWVAGADMNHLFASAGERWLTPLLARHDGVLTVAKDTPGAGAYERNAESFRRLRAVVVQSERDRDSIARFGLRPGALRLIRPGVAPAPYREARGPFTSLFASSPLTPGHFHSRGIHLIVGAAARLPDVRFVLAWRRRHIDRLRGMLAEADVKNVEILDGVVPDMGAVYDRVHATVLPALEPHSFIPCPRSGLESLAHGKPLLASHPVALASAVAEAGAGLAFEPTVAGLEGAIRRLRSGYETYQAQTQPYVARAFSPSVHLELYRRLYGVTTAPAQAPRARAVSHH
jgi:glycosyltransferase involved in cell wall biosynthesis